MPLPTPIRHSLLAWALLAAAACGADAPNPTAADIEHFERKVRPVLHRHCHECHSAQAKTLQGGLRLDSREALLRGGDSGPAVVPGKPGESLLISAVKHMGDFEMPPQGRLNDREVAALSDWVRRGAPYPGGAADNSGTRTIDVAEGRNFWSFQPLARHPLPDIANPAWPRRRIDFFLHASMEQHGLKPSLEADRATLVRRMTFDLIGLPPTPDQVRRFVEDDSPEAVERLVERLLAAPQFGERWARLWLDLARYTDATASWLYGTGSAHLYRDWVIQSLNEDMAYDRFVQLQLAADQLEGARLTDIPALGFLGLSPTYWKELKLPSEIIKVIVADEWEERVDVVSRTFLGLTVACARCHDHKFDPITMEDYYGLAGVFASTRLSERPLLAEEQYAPARAARKKVEELTKKLGAARKKKPVPEDEVASLETQIEELKRTPHYDAPLAHVVKDESMFVVRAGKTPQDGTRLDYREGPRDLSVFVRGDPNRPGPVATRRFIEVLSPPDAGAFQHGSGRRELAEAITNTAAPLAARVVVNRIWQAHFGQGLVETPSNFGQQGGRPSHPQLLDDLAARFVANGWSLKWLHREIVLSAAYRQSSAPDAAKSQRDPGNRWLWRMNRRRLDVEFWRDAMLAATGELSPAMGGAAAKVEDPTNVRRTLYATVHRRDMSPMLQIHDFPAPIAHSPQRAQTTTPLQGLYVLNSDFLHRRAGALAARLGRAGGDLAARVDEAYWRLFGRAATPEEHGLAKAFLGSAASDHQSDAWRQYAQALLGCNEFLFID